MQTVADVTRTVQNWMDGTSSQYPDFAGAFLYGGIVHLPDEVSFPDYRDVDLIIVLNQPRKVELTNLELLVEGIMVEVGFIGMDAISSPEAILANPEMAANFSVAKILADPLRILQPLQSQVKNAFAQRTWVLARCETELKSAWEAIFFIETSVTLFEKMINLWNVISLLTGLVALACLQPPTHRRSLIVSKNIFNFYQRADLHEQILRLWGSAELTRAVVQTLLDRSIPVFDRAVIVHKTPVPVDFKLKSHLRPYFLDASQEMINEGHHREATFWIALPALISSLAILADGMEEDKIIADAVAHDFYSCHGIFTPEDINARVPSARTLATTLDHFTREIINSYPG